MMAVENDVLVIEEKGIYSVEKFLLSRQLMYWQVYLHKTSLVAELILTKILKRAKFLAENKIEINCSKPLLFFIKNKINSISFDTKNLNVFSQLDDYDIISALKVWQNHSDYILATLSKMIINRDLLKIKLSHDKIDKATFIATKEKFLQESSLSESDAKYFVFKGKIKSKTYSKENDPISILRKDKGIEDLTSVSNQLNAKSISKSMTKYFICFPKNFYTIF
jgi:HD superfamily phosphohydrolase